MNNLLDLNDASLLSWILLLSVKGSVIIALVLLIQQLGRNVLPALLRYWLWIPALLCLFVPFSFATTWSPFVNFFTPVAPGPVDSTFVQTVSVEGVLESRSLTLSDFWIAGILAFSLVVLYNLIQFRRIRRNSRPADASAQEMLRHCQHELKIRRKVRLLETQRMGTPFVFGCIRPTILLPAGLTQEITTSELRFVLLHELSHVRRYDIALNWLMTSVQILHWFNPPVWYGFHCMRRDHEIACDASVLRHLRPSEYAAYGHTLILLMERYPRAVQFSQGLGIVGNTKPMKERLHMIKRFKTFQKRNVILGAVVLLVVAALAFSEKRASAHEGSGDDSEHGEESLHSQIQSLHELVLTLHGPDHEFGPSSDGVHSSHDVIEIIKRHKASDVAVAKKVRKRVPRKKNSTSVGLHCPGGLS